MRAPALSCYISKTVGRTKKMYMNNFVENTILRKFCYGFLRRQMHWKRDFREKPIFMTFDLRYLKTHKGRHMRFFCASLEHQNEGLCKNSACSASFRRWPFFLPYFPGVIYNLNYSFIDCITLHVQYM